VALSITTGSYRTDTGALTGYFASKNAMGGAAALFAVAAAGQIGPGRTRLQDGVGVSVLAGGLPGACWRNPSARWWRWPSGWPPIRSRHSAPPEPSAAGRGLAGLRSVAGFAIVLLIANIDAVAAFVLAATGKDITLTGRTDLWRVALDEIAGARGWVTGYQAFWRIGNPVAEELWRAFGIESRSGFHFHNFYLSNAVEIGIVGARDANRAVGSPRRSARCGLRCCRAGTTGRRAFRDDLMVLSVTPLEVPAFFPFNLQTFILMATLVYARDGLSASRGVGRSSGRGAGISTRA
jgi:exopolysaccharide production protein ExoQ